MPLLRRTYAIEQLTITYEWDRQRRFIEVLEPRLDEAVRAWEEAVGREAQEIEDEIQRDQFIDAYIDDFQEFQQHQVMLVNSFFTASWALFEYQLTKLCDLVQSRSTTQFSVKDLRGSFTRAASEYLAKLGVSFPGGDPEWSEIGRYRDIRNKIMHRGGIVSSRWGNYGYANARDLVNQSGGTLRLELTRSFCEEATQNFERFLRRVLYAIAQWDGSE